MFKTTYIYIILLICGQEFWVYLTGCLFLKSPIRCKLGSSQNGRLTKDPFIFLPLLLAAFSSSWSVGLGASILN